MVWKLAGLLRESGEWTSGVSGLDVVGVFPTFQKHRESLSHCRRGHEVLESSHFSILLGCVPCL